MSTPKMDSANRRSNSSDVLQFMHDDFTQDEAASS